MRYVKQVAGGSRAGGKGVTLDTSRINLSLVVRIWQPPLPSAQHGWTGSMVEFLLFQSLPFSLVCSDVGTIIVINVCLIWSALEFECDCMLCVVVIVCLQRMTLCLPHCSVLGHCTKSYNSITIGRNNLWGSPDIPLLHIIVDKPYQTSQKTKNNVWALLEYVLSLPCLFYMLVDILEM
jgi:hypothetical protein